MKRKQNGSVVMTFNTEADVMCGICFNIMHDPAMVGCECDRTFCFKCLEKILEIKCPMCNMKGNGKLVRCCRQFREGLDAMTRSCFNSDDGCRKKGNWAEIQKHVESECRYRPVLCPNLECGQRVPFRALFNHLKTCDRHRCSNFVCKWSDRVYGCPAMGTKNNVKQHEISCKYTKDAIAQIKTLLATMQKKT